jgi:hypothetical protein
VPPPSHPPVIRSIRHLGLAPAARTASWALVGQDGGQSIDLGDRTLFVFADTLIRLGDGSPGFLANCAAVSAARQFGPALSDLEYFCDPHGRPREVLPATPLERLAGYRFWPQHGVVIGGTVCLFYQGIRQFDPASTWGFTAAGSGLALLDPATGEARRLYRAGDWQLWSDSGAAVHRGVQVLRDGATVYVFAGHRRGDCWFARLSRVPADRIGDPTAYEYLATPDPTWAVSPDGGCDVAAAGPEFSVSFNPHLGRYLMTYVDGYTKRLFLRAADRVWGPYSDPAEAGVLPHRPQVDLIGLGFEHPPFAEDGGRTVYVTYCQPHFTQNSVVALRFA